MGISTHLSPDGRACTIKVNGRFDFDIHHEWRTASESIVPGDVAVTVDFTETEYIDSSALGMLLLLRDHLGQERADIRVIGCNAVIHNVLTIANFHRLFKLD